MIPLLGLLAGIVLGVVLEPSIPQMLQPYLPIAIVARDGRSVRRVPRLPRGQLH